MDWLISNLKSEFLYYNNISRCLLFGLTWKFQNAILLSPEAARKPTIHSLCLLAQNFLTASTAVDKLFPSSRPQRADNSTWILPKKKGCVKLNANATVNVPLRCIVIGGPIRDNSSFCVGTFNAKFDFYSPLFAKVLAINRGLK